MSKDGLRNGLIAGGVVTATSLYFFSDKVSFLKELGTKPRRIYAPPPTGSDRGGGNGGGGNGSSNGYDGEGSNDTYEMVSNATPFVAVALLIIAAAVLWPRQNSGGSAQAA